MQKQCDRILFLLFLLCRDRIFMPLLFLLHLYAIAKVRKTFKRTVTACNYSA